MEKYSGEVKLSNDGLQALQMEYIAAACSSVDHG
jgi:hypothetical protein